VARGSAIVSSPAAQWVAGTSRRLPRPTVNWTPDTLGKGIFSIQRELNERFATVLT
jgi:hypothetical protein